MIFVTVYILRFDVFFLVFHLNSTWFGWCEGERVHGNIPHGFIWVASWVPSWIWTTPCRFQQPKPTTNTKVLRSLLLPSHEKQWFPYARRWETVLWTFSKGLYLEYSNCSIPGACLESAIVIEPNLNPVTCIFISVYTNILHRLFSRLKEDGGQTEKVLASGTHLLTLPCECSVTTTGTLPVTVTIKLQRMLPF